MDVSPNFSKAVDLVLNHEGDKFTDTPADHGGPTKYGVTLPVMSDFLGRPASADDIKNLDEMAATHVYHQLFWMPNSLDQIESELFAAVLFDQMVLNGAASTIARLQRILGVNPDGKLGLLTFAAIAREHPEDLAFKLCRACVHHYSDIVAKDPSQAKFIAGWVDRVFSLLDYVFFGELI